MTAIHSLPETGAITVPGGGRWRSIDGGRVPSLDGLRAVSISMVVGQHVINKIVRARTGRDYEGVWLNLLNGHLGVSIFFVISGFLITHLLLREKTRSGRLDLGKFYLRRTFRIWPAFFTYFGFVLLLHHFGAFGIARREIIGAATFTYNYVPHTGNPRVSAAWSLSVEEQFYLFWPLAFAFTSRRRSIVFWVAGIIAVVPLVRLLEVMCLPRTNVLVERLWQMTHTRADTLMFGGLLALLWDRSWFQRFMGRLFRWKWHWLCAAFLLTEASILKPLYDYKLTTGLAYSVEGAAVAIVLVWLVVYESSWIGSVLNSRAAVHLGILSYGIYLWNPPFCTPMNTTWSGRFPLNIIFTLLAAELSLLAVEKPFLVLRDRYAGRGRQTVVRRIPEAGLSSAGAG